MANNGSPALLGLYNNAVHFFDYVHINPSCGNEFEQMLLKLDSSQLMLSRWGEAMNISGVVVHENTWLPPAFTEERKIRAESLLSEMLRYFNDASTTYEASKKPVDPDSVGSDRWAGFQCTTICLHRSLSGLSLSRMNSAPRTVKGIFHLLDEHQSNEFINNVTKLAKDLVELFPDVEKKQVELADEEVMKLSSSLRKLGQAATGSDKILVQALSKFLTSTVSWL
jgi:hypothetical protein